LTSAVAKPSGLALAHLWVALGAFLLAVLLGLYQVLERSQLIPSWAEGYYISVTVHGTVMAYVLTLFFIAGFAYATASSSLKRPVWNLPLAWLGFWVMLIGVALVLYAVLTGRGTVMYTFYPPLTAHWTFYVGAALLVVGSLAWVIIMVVMTMQWKSDNPGQPVPLSMYGTATNAILWSWTLVGVAVEVLFLLVPLSLGWVDTVDVGLARTLFSWTLHPIVYVWLIPAYLLMYTIAPKVAGGRLFSDEMARVAFIMLLVFGLPIGMHHLYADPFQSDGWKLLHAFGTFVVVIPTLITGFTVIASMEIAGRLRGGKGLFGWIRALPWHEPVVLAEGLALLMLTIGGFSGVVNASYGMNSMVHNTCGSRRTST
jgi:cytochrome c oxidase subunit I